MQRKVLDLELRRDKWCTHGRQEVHVIKGQLEVEGWKGTYRRTWEAKVAEENKVD